MNKYIYIYNKTDLLLKTCALVQLYIMLIKFNNAYTIFKLNKINN